MCGTSTSCDSSAYEHPRDRRRLGRAVRRLRKAQGLKIEVLACAADMHPTYLSGIERGLRNPTWRKLCGLADALEVSVSTLAAEAEEEAAITRITLAARARLRSRSPQPTPRHGSM